MNHKRFLYLLTFFVISSFAYSSEGDSIPGFYVDGRFLYSPLGEKVILRGVNEMSCWVEEDPTGKIYLPEIAKTGANSVRLTLVNSTSAEQIDSLITNCLQNNMIPIPENHSATGLWNNLQEVVDWWCQPDIINVIKKHERYILVNIANEAGDWNVTEEQFRSSYSSAISQLRSAGIKTPLMIDASGWGQDINILQSTWKQLLEVDPLRNLIFSVHMWWTDSTDTARVINEISESVEIGIPLLVGEFAHKGPGCKCCIPYQIILEECKKNEIGYLAWSWGAVGNQDCVEMSMTCDGTFETLGRGIDCERGDNSWGWEVAINSPFSILNTSVRPKWILDRLVIQNIEGN